MEYSIKEIVRIIGAQANNLQDSTISILLTDSRRLSFSGTKSILCPPDKDQRRTQIHKGTLQTARPQFCSERKCFRSSNRSEKQTSWW